METVGSTETQNGAAAPVEYDYAPTKVLFVPIFDKLRSGKKIGEIERPTTNLFEGESWGDSLEALLSQIRQELIETQP